MLRDPNELKILETIKKHSIPTPAVEHIVKHRRTIRIKDVFLDMDGILTDFIAGVCRLFDKDPFKVKADWPRGVYDLHTAFGGNPCEAEIWAAIAGKDSFFWQGLSIETDAIKLLNALQRYRKGPHTWVVTTPPPTHGAQAMLGKKHWLEANVGRDFDRYFFCVRKDMLARPDRLLIDDCDENCRAFQRAGGRSLLWPRPWNSAHKKERDRWALLEEILY